MKNKKLHVKVGDTVMIMSGKDSEAGENRQGKVGKVLAVSPSKGKIIVEGCNVVDKHVKPRRMGEMGGVVKAEAPLYASKVMHVDPVTKKPVRVGYKMEEYTEVGKDGIERKKFKKTRITVGKNASGSEI